MAGAAKAAAATGPTPSAAGAAAWPTGADLLHKGAAGVRVRMCLDAVEPVGTGTGATGAARGASP